MKTKKIVIRFVFIVVLLLTVFVFWITGSKAKQQNANESVIFMPENEIDNYGNVENYKYHFSKKIVKNTFRLKDCNYRFVDQINIPGMPSTREQDFLNKYIFSDSQCPQGICFTEDYLLITSYSTEDGCLGEVLVFDKLSGEYLVTLGMDANSHLGGIAYDGKSIWVCNSYDKSIERISYDFIQLMAECNKGSVIDATDLVDVYPVDIVPSCITYYGGRLWIATHTIFLPSQMKAYYYNNQKELISLSKYNIPCQVQGIAFTNDGSILLSTSYGRNKSSYIKAYASVSDLSNNPSKPDVQIEMPPGSEEIDILDDSVYVIFETAGKKYYEGTDGKGTSNYPLDKILEISIDSFLGR